MNKNLAARGEKGLFYRLFALGVAGACAGAWMVGCSSIPLARSADVGQQVQRDLQQAVALRGLPANRGIAIERETPSELHASLAKELDKEENRAFLAESELLLKQFRVIKRDEDLKAIYLRVMSQQIAAYYDPEKKRVAYVENGAGTNRAALPGMERFVYVHEFCHALEDGQFNLEKLTKEAMSSFDRDLALTSFVEGNAVLLGMDGAFAEAPVNTATPLGACAVGLFGYMGADDGQQKELQGCPAFLGGALVRPYLDGAVFSNRIRREAGWQAVNGVYRGRLPLTTAEILYPEKRFLKAFKAAEFAPPEALFRAAQQGVATNSLGALGTALWFGGDKLALPRQYGFLKGWLGDRIYLLKRGDGSVATVWLSYLERPGQAAQLERAIGQRLRKDFADVPWRVVRDGRLVAAVWGSVSGALSADECGALASAALQTRVTSDRPSLLASWCEDFPWPVRFPSYRNDYSVGCRVLGGYVADVQDGDGFFRFNLASGLLLRAEDNPDRHYFGTLFGLARHVEDERSDFTYWRLPLLATWFRRGSGAERQCRWSVLWGLLASGSETESRVLFVPVWHPAPNEASEK